ncbi:N-acetylmuramoyl-L-alanine amidase [Lunatimonas lonarensis]|uniref:N-acetylmuramoyl-L-alanine amidase n=1 Tax=Lunatimonas lonarensis TaxID=1232681 RepID=R7ZPR7_9BACT|nr:N-acetylmuramoyl-L-alanine amidase [Lunatimonas lonarensis]EON76106.1 N-acetylmuramoyl-L-alanine amidase [Lunatimonas lonarensis]
MKLAPFYRSFLWILFLLSSFSGIAQQPIAPLAGKVICLDPGHGGTADTDQYRVGLAGEREEWINLRVGLVLKRLLEKAGATVLMTRESDLLVSLADRAEMAVANKADMFVSIHHNATADRSVNFPIVYFHGSAEENLAGVRLAKLIGDSFVASMFKGQSELSVVSDFAIFPNSGAGVLRGTYGIPAVVAEASFFSDPKEEKRLRRRSYNQKEAKAYFEAISAFFSHSADLPILEKKQPLTLTPFLVFQEAERMSPEAKNWHGNFMEGKKIVDDQSIELFDKALDLLTLSVKSFPDSPVAGVAHDYRARVLEALGKEADAEQERRRRRHFYPQW